MPLPVAAIAAVPAVIGAVEQIDKALAEKRRRERAMKDARAIAKAKVAAAGGSAKPSSSGNGMMIAAAVLAVVLLSKK